MEKDFILLQINDSLFPIGGYAHSYGLETYIQKGLVHNAATAGDYLHSRLYYSLLYTDLLAVRIAYTHAVKEDVVALQALTKRLQASKSAQETRQASQKLGSRFYKTVEALPFIKQSIWQQYQSGTPAMPLHHTVAYGVLCAACGIGLPQALQTFLYAQVAGIVTNCVKAVPLSQTDGQRLLAQSFADMQAVLNLAQTVPEEMLCLNTPGFELRAMQHEHLYSRLYMS